MSVIKNYLAYIKDNPQGYWFKRKLYGWGWTPVTWQGFTVLALYLGGVVNFAIKAERATTIEQLALEFLVPISILTVVLLALCFLKGETPKWQWGIPKKKE